MKIIKSKKIDKDYIKLESDRRRFRNVTLNRKVWDDGTWALWEGD